MIPTTRHCNTTGHGCDSGMVQQLCPGAQIQWKTQAMPRPSKVKSSVHKVSTQRSHT